MQDTTTDAAIVEQHAATTPLTKPETPSLAKLEAPAYNPARPVQVTGEAEKLFRSAMQDYSGKNFLSASVTLRQATSVDPDAPELRYYLGMCYLMTRDTVAAIRELKVAAALENNPYEEEVRLYLGKAFYRQKDYVHAAEQFEQITANPELRREAILLRQELKSAGI